MNFLYEWDCRNIHNHKWKIKGISSNNSFHVDTETLNCNENEDTYENIFKIMELEKILSIKSIKLTTP